MIRPSIRFPACAAAALMLMSSLTAQAQTQPSDFSLPPPSPTPTPAPEGPADERSGVVIPPRAVPTPQIDPAPVLGSDSQTAIAPVPGPVPKPLAIPQPTPRATGAARPSPQAAPQPVPTATASPSDTAPEPGFSVVPSPSPSSPGVAAETLAAADAPPSNPLGKSMFDWLWALGAIVPLAFAALFILMTLRRRKPKVLRLAPPPAGMQHDAAAVPDLPRLDLALEVSGATRSLMMFTLAYRLTLANRTDQAVTDLGIAVQLACARQSASNAAPLAAAQLLAKLDRIGPHQSRSITGEVQLPLSAITPLRQGNQPLFIPLLHVTLEGEGQRAVTHSFVVGTPSTTNAARLHPILLDTPPGSIPDLRAQAVDAPSISAAS